MGRSLWLALPLLLTACGRGGDTVTPDSPGTWAGRPAGEFFQPEFQRWRIVDAGPLAGAEIPADLTGIPMILLGRDVHLAPGYYTFPFLNGPGDQVLPACFRATAGELRGVAVTSPTASPATVPEGLHFVARPDGRVVFTLDRRFVLTLERQPLPDDGGYQQRRFDAHFNERLAQGTGRDSRPPACTLEARAVALEPPRNLVLVATDNGRSLTLPGAELDPETPLTPNSASVPQRRSLPLGDPDAIVAGCAGIVRILRAVTETTRDTPPRERFLLVGGIAGKTAEGELCDRVDLVRHIDPARILALYGQPVPERGLTMQLLGWVDEDTFTARVGDSEFELAGVEGPRILVSRLKGPGEADPEVALEPELEPPPAPAAARGTRAGTPAPPRPSRKIERWVDEDGVIHYSNMGRPPEQRRRD